MLSDLKILNGNLELKFDKYNYIYTVTVDSTINSLEFTYKLDSDATLEIIDNELLAKDNIVYLKVTNKDLEETIYTFYVTKNAEVVSGINNYKESLELNKPEELALYKVQILSISLFFLIIIIFTLMFKKQKSK